jgi:hypothetical protein
MSWIKSIFVKTIGLGSFICLGKFYYDTRYNPIKFSLFDYNNDKSAYGIILDKSIGVNVISISHSFNGKKFPTEPYTSVCSNGLKILRHTVGDRFITKTPIISIEKNSGEIEKYTHLFNSPEWKEDQYEINDNDPDYILNRISKENYLTRIYYSTPFSGVKLIEFNWKDVPVISPSEIF